MIHYDVMIDLERIVAPGRVREINAHANLTVESFVRSKVPNRPTRLSVGYAVDVLDQLHSDIEIWLKELASEFSPVQWLWYLRRCNSAIYAKGQYCPTSRFSNQLIAEIAGATSSTTSRPVKTGGRNSYPINEAICEKIVRLCFAARRLRALQAIRRRAAKNFEMDVSCEGVLNVVPSPQREQAVQVYDQRQSSGQQAWSGLGLATTDDGWPAAADWFVGVSPIREPIVRPVYDFASNRRVSVRSQFILMGVGTGIIQKYCDIAGGAPTEWNDYVLPLLTLLTGLPVLLGQYPQSTIALALRGYVVFSEPPRNIVEQIGNCANPTIERACSRSVKPQELYDALAWLSGPDFRELVLPVMRESDGAFVLDAFAASRLLHDRISDPIPKGTISDKKSRLFELQVQTMLDESPWKPQSDIRKMQGRRLRIGGRDLTDLDAVGTRGTTLLIVSCKSVRITNEYVAGNHNVVRNCREIVEHAVEGEVKNGKKKRGIAEVAKILQSQAGDNFDFTKFSQVIGVVCTPTRIYVESESALSFVAPALRAACSFSELAEWIRSDTGSREVG